MKFEKLADKDLIRYIDKNKKSVFQEIYKRTVEGTYKYIYSRCGNKEMTEDVVSDAYVTLYEIIEKYNGDSKLQTFIIGIALNKLRQTRFRQTNDLAYDDNIIILDDFEYSDSDKKLKEESLVLLGKLPIKYKRVLEARYLEGKSYEEIGKELGITSENARKIKSRALLKAQELYINKIDHE